MGKYQNKPDAPARYQQTKPPGTDTVSNPGLTGLQAGSAGSQGGSTRFEELKGDVTVSNGRFIYRDVELSAGILSASSNFNISGNQDVSGRVYVTLRSPVQRLSANLNITGTLKGITLKP